MSDGYTAQNTMIEISENVSPASWVQIKECKTIPGPDETSDEIEFTHLKSPGNRREFKQSFKDSADIALECNRVPGDPGQALARSSYDTGDTMLFRITDDTDSTWVFDGYIKGRGTAFAVAAGVPFNIAIRVTGIVEFTEG